MRARWKLVVVAVAVALTGAVPASASENGGAPPASRMEPGSQAGMERAVNAEDAAKGTGSKKPDAKARKAKKKSRRQKQEASEAAGAGGSTDRSR
jgi:hypothetical protein